MNNNRKWYLLFSILLVSCQVLHLPTSVQLPSQNIDILDNLICDPPCWQNLLPGTASLEEFTKTLSLLEFVDQDSVYISESLYPGFRTRAGCGFMGNHTALVALFSENKLAWMEFQDDLSATLGQVIQALGEPEKVAIDYHGGDMNILLLSPEKGIAFGYITLGKPDWAFIEMRPEIEVDYITYFDAAVYQELIDARIIIDSEQAQQVLYPWKGYGEIEVLYPLP